MEFLLMLRSLVVFMILCTCQVELLSQEGKQLAGSIEFQDVIDVPKKLEEGSCLNIALKESTDFTAAKEIASKTDKDVKDLFDKDKNLKYKIDLPNMNFTAKKDYLVSAVLNIGWCKEKSDKTDSGEWIRDGDFLTDILFVADGLVKCSKESKQTCDGPKLVLVMSKPDDDKIKEQDDGDKEKKKEKEKEKDKDDGDKEKEKEKDKDDR